MGVHSILKQVIKVLELCDERFLIRVQGQILLYMNSHEERMITNTLQLHHDRCHFQQQILSLIVLYTHNDTSKNVHEILGSVGKNWSIPSLNILE